MMCLIYVCHIHTKKGDDGNLILPKHTTRQCRLLIQSFREKGQPSETEKVSGKEEDKEEDDFE